MVAGEFNQVNGRSFQIKGPTYGVIDHNNGTTTGQFGIVEGDSNGNASWALGSNLGSADAVYLEDNTLSCNSTTKLWMVADADDGGRVVVRNNTFTNHYAGGHDASSVNRGLVQYEVYGNTLTSTFNYGEELISMRGGTGVVFNNNLITTSSSPFGADTGGSGINFANYRDDSGPGGTLGLWTITNVNRCSTSTTLKACLDNGSAWRDTTCTTDADCGGTVGSCTMIDGTGTAGYPCRDQIVVADNALTIKPWLVWNNKININNGGWKNVTSYVRPYNTTPHIVINRDYCENATTMPTTCNGVSSTYTPYTYPHPLISRAVILPSPQKLR